MRRRRLLCLLRGVAAVAAASVWGPALAADAVARLVDALESSHSFKVRVQAAALLGRMHDPRAGEALVRASAADPHPLVRVVALKLLAKSAASDRPAAERARRALGRALSD